MANAIHSIIDTAVGNLPAPIHEFVERFRRGDVLLHAAGLAFYALVSAAPLAISVLWIVSLVMGDARVGELAERAQGVMPKGIGAGDALQGVARLGTRLGVVALLTGMWPATSYGAGLSRAFHAVADEDADLRGLRGRALLLVALLPVFAFGGLIVAFVTTSVLGPGPIRGPVGYLLGFLGGLAGTAVSVAVIYAVFPPKRPPTALLIRATIIASTAVGVLTIAYTLFLRFGADFEEHYATSGIAGIVLFGLWLFLANAAVIVGYTYALED